MKHRSRFVRVCAMLACSFWLGMPAGFAAAPSAEYERLNAIAGEPIDAVRFFRVHYWQPIGERALVLWLGREEPYLLDLRERCHGLTREMFLRVADYRRPGRNQLRARWSEILMPEGRTCRIGKIRALDYPGLAQVSPRVVPPAPTPDASPRASATVRRYWADLKVLKATPPVYPAVTGRPPAAIIRVAAKVNRQGGVEFAEILLSGGDQAFDQAAVDAVRHWQFEPQHNPNSEHVWVDVPVTLRVQ